MFSLAKKVALIGIGLSEQAKDLISELEKRGEESQHKDAIRLKSLFDSAEKGEREFCQKMDDLCKKVSGRIKFPACSDFERLERGLTDLETKFHEWETTRQFNRERSPS
jgi:polyhydroxyalkanoate synthesis regulator phasin